MPPNIQDILQQAQAMQEKLASAQPEARFQEVTEFGRMLLRFADPLTDLRYRPVFGNG
jgi:hypothetical protein